MTKKEVNRRKFITECSLKLAGASLLLNQSGAKPAFGEEKQPKPEKNKEPHMEYRSLGKTGLKVSALSFGAAGVNEPGVLYKALEMGLNFFDTCCIYKGGKSEKLIGKVLKEYGRKKAYVATKIYPIPLIPPLPPEDREGEGPLHVKIDIPVMEKLMDESLRKLQTDYVDVLYLYEINDPAWQMNEELIGFLEKMKKAGKARFTGISFHETGRRYVEIIDTALKTDYFDVFLAAFNFKSPPEHIEALKRAHKKSVGVVAMKTQAGGYRKGTTGGLTPHQAALKWVLDSSFVDCTITGMVNLEQLEENAGAVGKKVSWHDRKVLSTYYAAVKDRLCLRCGGCSATCPLAVNIPAVHRSLMYWEGYQDFSLGRDSYQRLTARNARACVNCSAPTCRCVNGMKIPERMRQAHAAFA
jgi:hypothetical protein